MILLAVLAGACFAQQQEAEPRRYQQGTYVGQELATEQQPYSLDFGYHDYDRMTKFLRTTSSKYPNLTALYSIGKSVQGNVLLK